ncbi:MAG: hybrid sensor histidine kinase/response regulator [Gammaproteobacteria bacterium]|nr:hybrid sensor histidine kinase/response regulator [Gammaproteobacteria bacterium]
MAHLTERNNRILIIDDNLDIHNVFHKVLNQRDDKGLELAAAEAALFDDSPTHTASAFKYEFELSDAHQGQEGFEMVKRAHETGLPYALAFVDMRMPPGWDGLETIEKLWSVDPDLQVVICSAYSDHTWHDISHRLNQDNKLLILQKPFDNIEIIQAAHSLTEKWAQQKEERLHLEVFNSVVKEQHDLLEQTTQALAEQKIQQTKIEDSLIVAHKLRTLGQVQAGVCRETGTHLHYLLKNLQGLQHDVEHMSIESANENAALKTQMDASVRTSLSTTRSALTLVEALLSFDQSDIVIETETDINAMIQRLLAVIKNDCEYIATLRTQFAELPLVYCNVGDIAHVLLNLLSNARHAIAVSEASLNSNESSEIVISTSYQNNHVLISVCDSGDGVPKNIADKIFEPFFTTKARGKGIGLGLTIARDIIMNDHGGALYFANNADAGATFTISLPVDPRLAATLAH